ncbi:MAG: glycine--tRNA ligase subunit beta, partial [Candidatus Cloacimonadota bacterium]|nr:glycine--tRNA ligase subunit beta [Candidatus Cloacimonadota bacterium]
MDKKDFLFEIGVEEIPAAYIAGAIKTIKDHFESNLKKANLDYNKLQIFSTPRRLAIKILSLQTQQKDEVIERTGPTKEIAYDIDGNLTNAALGFLRGAGAEQKDIIIKQTPKGDKIAIRKEIKGKPATTILIGLIKDAIAEIKFQKSMKWGSSKLTFARPIRWLLVLFGNEIIELEFGNIKSGNITFGNRFQKLDNPAEINSIDEYEEKLESVFVIPDRGKRFKLIQVGIEEILNSIQNKYHDKLDYVDDKDNLINIVTDLVEYPTPILSEFDIKYLELFNNIPNVIIQTLSEHQKYFPINENGELTNKFIIIGNGNPKYKELIKLGNNKVVNARLADAAFYYNEDTKISLEYYVPKLKEVIFQSKLGTLFEKTERIKKLIGFLCDELDIDSDVKKHSLRAAHLCKADLVTLMLGEKEYTKLQGMVGYEYALKSKEDIKVAIAIFSHYMPRSNYDSLPIGKEGAILAIADKVDTICGIIGVDMIPTGSKDPFALRRAANGVVQIISNNSFEINIHKLIDISFKLLESKLDKSENNKNMVYDFFKQRVNW